MRITGGEWAGRRLRAPRGRSVRPTADRVRESLFARLGSLAEVRVLDLFAGTGALGIEALSRGAEQVVFVEKASAPLAALRANLEQLGLGSPRALVQPGDALAALRRLGRATERFNLVLMDPPYASEEVEAALAALVEGRLLAPDGQVVVEASRHQLPPAVPGLVGLDERRYGDTVTVRLVADGSQQGGAGGP